MIISEQVGSNYCSRCQHHLSVFPVFVPEKKQRENSRASL